MRSLNQRYLINAARVHVVTPLASRHMMTQSLSLFFPDPDVDIPSIVESRCSTDPGAPAGAPEPFSR